MSRFVESITAYAYLNDGLNSDKYAVNELPLFWCCLCSGFVSGIPLFY